NRLHDVPSWECWVAGAAQRPGEERLLGNLQTQIQRIGLAGRVRFLGTRSDVGNLMASADVYCQPNVRPEAFGISFIEALYAGLPVLTSALGGALEIVDADCGLLIPPGDPIRLADSLNRLILMPNLRKSLGARGPHKAHSLCDPARSLERLHQLLS